MSGDVKWYHAHVLEFFQGLINRGSILGKRFNLNSLLASSIDAGASPPPFKNGNVGFSRNQ
jgi:hypothetical protein